MEIKIDDWKTLTFSELESKYSMSRADVYEYAMSNSFYNHKAIIEKGRLGDIENTFILNNENLSVSQFANLFHKSYNAMLIYLKTKGYYELIKKK